MGDVSGPQRSMLDAFDLISLVSNGPDELFAAAREKVAGYSEPGDLVAGVASVASVAAMVLDVLASVSDQSSTALLEQIHHRLGDVLLERNGDEQD